MSYTFRTAPLISTMSTTTSHYPSLPSSYLHPGASFSSGSLSQPSFSHSGSYNTTSPSSSSVEPVTPELSPPNNHASIMSTSGKTIVKDEHDRRTSSASALSADGDDNIECKWEGCDHLSPSADELYDHLCNAHVGRKSTGNLNLTCGWEGCGVKCVKRDHITSHLRGQSCPFYTSPPISSADPF